MSEFSDMIVALPELFLAIIGLLGLVVGVMRRPTCERPCFVCWSVAASFLIALVFLFGISWERSVIFNGMFVMDQLSGVLKTMMLIALPVVLALAIRWLHQEQMERFEYAVLLLFAGLGMMLMVSANDFLSAYMGLELQSLALYVMATMRRDHTLAAEAGIKYFILGALASGLLLFGVSLIYGFTGSTNFDVIASTLGGLDLEAGDINKTGVIVGMVFILIGLAFKLSIVPFHMWTPDVYEGAAMPVTMLFAVLPKVAAAGLLLRVLFGPFGTLIDEWQQILWVLSVGSMVVGAYAALAQTNIKRLMAYSSISHMGYALIGVVAGTPAGVSATILYLMIYMVTVTGIFSVLLMMRREGRPVRELSDLAGVSRDNPPLAYALALFMFSSGAIPPMAGFFAKMFVFEAAIAEQMYVIAVIGVLTSVVAVFYYLRIIKVAFFDERGEKFDKDDSIVRWSIVSLCLLFVMLFIVMPDGLVHWAHSAATALF